jgi:DNA mismatch repair protein MutH
MERQEAIRRISDLKGHDLRRLADRLGITVWKNVGTSSHPDCKLNKGWCGHTIERYLGLPLNSSRSPNFGSWELKVVPVKRLRDGSVAVKETMAITMIDPYEVRQKEFHESHLFNKLQKIVIVAREFIDVTEASSVLYSVGGFDLSDKETCRQVKEDYDLVRKIINVSGFDALSGGMGKLVQPRTKGPGHGSTSRAFYARVHFVAHMLGI